MTNTSHPKPSIATQYATRAMFFIGGFGAATWAPLVPLFKHRLGIAEDVLGLLLLCIGIGSLLTMPLSGALSTRFGCRRVLSVVSVAFASILIVLALVPSLSLAVLGLLSFGVFMGAIDVVVNIHAILVEQAAGKRMMSGMHAFWSVGGFAGAGLFSLWTATFGLTPLQSTCIAAGIIVTLILIIHRYLLPYGGGDGGALIAIPRGIVIVVGIVAFISFLSEGAIMDWSGIFLTEVHHFDLSFAGMGFSLFSGAMLIMRFFGDVTVHHLGQKLIVLGGSVLAVLGFLAIIFGEAAILLYAGFFIIGIGVANIIPVFFSLLGKQNVMPISLAVSAVGTFGYLGILAGPAVIGFLAHATNLYAAFAFLAALTALQGILAAFVYRKMGV